VQSYSSLKKSSSTLSLLSSEKKEEGYENEMPESPFRVFKVQPFFQGPKLKA
jgi:hypothetical protein